MVGCSALEPLKRHAAFDLFGLRMLIEHVEHASARGKRLLQRGAQIRHGDNRPKRRHERRACHNGASEIEHAVVHQVHRREQHAHIERQDHSARRRHGNRRAPLQASLDANEAIHAIRQFLRAVARATELQGFAQTAQAVEHEGIHRANGIAHFTAARAARFRGNPRHRNAHNRIRECDIERQQR